MNKEIVERALDLAGHDLHRLVHFPEYRSEYKALTGLEPLKWKWRRERLIKSTMDVLTQSATEVNQSGNMEFGSIEECYRGVRDVGRQTLRMLSGSGPLRGRVNGSEVLSDTKELLKVAVAGEPVVSAQQACEARHETEAAVCRVRQNGVQAQKAVLKVEIEAMRAVYAEMGEAIDRRRIVDRLINGAHKDNPSKDGGMGRG